MRKIDYAEKNKETNKEYKLEYDKTYREKNKDKINAWRSIKIKCCCGSETRQNEKSRHEKTQKHLKYMSEILKV